MKRLDKLLIRGLRVFGKHGVYAEEKSLGQHFLIDIDVYADVKRACFTDAVQDTVDYSKVARIAREVVGGKSQNLVEKVAQDVANRVLNEMIKVQCIRIRVLKPEVALEGVQGGVGVEIERRRNENLPEQIIESQHQNTKNEE